MLKHLLTASLLLMASDCYGQLTVELDPVQTNTIQQTAPNVTNNTGLIIRTPAGSCASTGQSDANIRSV